MTEGRGVRIAISGRVGGGRDGGGGRAGGAPIPCMEAAGIVNQISFSLPKGSSVREREAQAAGQGEGIL